VKAVHARVIILKLQDRLEVGLLFS
jgi:hypothetical protein